MVLERTHSTFIRPVQKPLTSSPVQWCPSLCPLCSPAPPRGGDLGPTTFQSQPPPDRIRILDLHPLLCKHLLSPRFLCFFCCFILSCSVLSHLVYCLEQQICWLEGAFCLQDLVYRPLRPLLLTTRSAECAAEIMHFRIDGQRTSISRPLYGGCVYPLQPEIALASIMGRPFSRHRARCSAHIPRSSCWLPSWDLVGTDSGWSDGAQLWLEWAGEPGVSPGGPV